MTRNLPRPRLLPVEYVADIRDVLALLEAAASLETAIEQLRREYGI